MPEITYDIVAYDKDHDIYHVLQTGPYEKLRPLLEDYMIQCKKEMLRNPYNNEPFDWVFMELTGSEGTCGQILPDNI